MRAFVLPYYILFCPSLERKGGGVDLGWQEMGRDELGGVEGTRTVVGMYCIREEFVFKKKTKNIKKKKSLYLLTNIPFGPMS